MCVEMDLSFQNVGSVRVRNVQSSLNCALRLDAEQMQSRIESLLIGQCEAKSGFGTMSALRRKADKAL